MSTVTTLARRIARAHNDCGGHLAGGMLAFDHDGNGGEWYSAGAQLRVPYVFPVGAKRVTGRDVQDWLDESDEAIRAQLDEAERGEDARKVLLGALRAIADEIHSCSVCGVEYASGYSGPCQEPWPSAMRVDGRWTRMCSGTVSAATTAKRAIIEIDAPRTNGVMA